MEKKALNETVTSSEVKQNLQDIKQALEKILEATSPIQVANAVKNTPDDISKVASVAKLHSYAAEAYAHLLEMMAKREG